MIQHNTLRSTIPPSRINDSMMLNDNHWSILNTHSGNFINKSFQHPAIPDRRDFDINIGHDYRAPRSAFVMVVTETIGDYPYPYFTEKTWKAIVSSLPFMIVGSRYSLRKLHDFGFQTFSNWWDESYDEHKHVADRIKHITDELKKLCSLSLSELEDYRQQILPIVNYNLEHLAQFRNDNLLNLQKALQLVK